MNDPQYVFQQIRQLKLTQDDLKREITEGESDEMHVVVNGELKLLDLKVPGLPPAKQNALKNLINKAYTEAQGKIMLPLQKKVSQ